MPRRSSGATERRPGRRSAWVVSARGAVALLVGRDDSDVLFLQVKEPDRSVLERHVGNSEFEYKGQRVVVGQELLQASSDIVLGWDENTDGDGVLHQFADAAHLGGGPSFDRAMACF